MRPARSPPRVPEWPRGRRYFERVNFEAPERASGRVDDHDSHRCLTGPRQSSLHGRALARRASRPDRVHSSPRGPRPPHRRRLRPPRDLRSRSPTRGEVARQQKPFQEGRFGGIGERGRADAAERLTPVPAGPRPSRARAVVYSREPIIVLVLVAGATVRDLRMPPP